MKSPYAGELQPNETITAQFLVLSKEIRQKKTGEPYLSLQLGDKTGEIDAKMWDNVAEVLDSFDRDDFVKIRGLTQLHQKRLQLTVHKIRKLVDKEVDFDDFFPCSERDSGEMWAELLAIVEGIRDEHLRGLLRTLFQDEAVGSRFRVAPAAKQIHHACRGGLLEHVLSLCQLARLTAAHYKVIDLDLLLTGVLLHDIGKIEELNYTRSFSYSAEGQLLGHIVIGLRLVGEASIKVPGFPIRLRTLVEHMILSHHGQYEFGSPKLPMFPEALLLHQLDNLDSKMESMRSALARPHDASGEFTGWIPALERVALRKAAYLEPPAPLFDGLDTPGVGTDPNPDQTPTPVHARAEPAPKLAPNSLFGEKLKAVWTKENELAR